MLAGLPFAILALAAAASAAAPAPAQPQQAQPQPSPPPQAQPPLKTSDERCAPAPRTTNDREIVVCVEKPQGYRIDPDVLASKRAMRGGGRPKRPERLRDTACASVGPAGCIGAGAGINLIGAALTAAEMAARLSKGQEIGSMFRTTPEMSEYELYQEAKRAREAKEAEAAAAAAAQAKAAPKAPATAAAGRTVPTVDPPEGAAPR
jgi:hypothetical protein